MELRQLEYFVAVAAELNFSRAAQRIHVVQSALSASVGRLEKELGVDLFDRSKRQIALTTAGEVFLDHAREVMLAAHRAESSIAEYRGQLMTTVALGTLMTWGKVNLPAALEEFRQSYPKVTVRLRQNTTGSAGHLAAIADGQMDLALVSIPSPRSPLVTVRELTREPMVFVCDATHPLARRKRLPLVDLAGQDLIQFPLGWGIREHVDAGFAAVGTQPVSAFEVADYAIAAELIRHRLATTILPVSVADRFPDLRKIDVDPPLVWTMFIASVGPQFTNRAIDALADIITRHVDH
jgi:DNA-binding transcriptional LysR family regulator